MFVFPDLGVNLVVGYYFGVRGGARRRLFQVLGVADQREWRHLAIDPGTRLETRWRFLHAQTMTSSRSNKTKQTLPASLQDSREGIKGKNEKFSVKIETGKKDSYRGAPVQLKQQWMDHLRLL